MQSSIADSSLPGSHSKEVFFSDTLFSYPNHVLLFTRHLQKRAVLQDCPYGLGKWLFTHVSRPAHCHPHQPTRTPCHRHQPQGRQTVTAGLESGQQYQVAVLA